MKSEKSYKKIVFWILPITLFIIIGFFIYLFITPISKINKTEFKPDKIIEIQEPFSGKVYFNDELGGNVLSNLVINAINSASSSVEMAIYSMDDNSIRDAIYRASERGVKVSMVFSNKNVNTLDRLFGNKPDNILRKDVSSVGDGYSEYMHHKFMIIDRDKGSRKLLFGSYNYTLIQDKYDPSFILETNRKEIIDIYGEEFDRVLSNVHGTEKFSSKSYNPFTALIKYPDGFLEIWFTPQNGNNGIKNRMIQLIEESSYDIKSMIWLMTDVDIAESLVLASKHKKVSILTDDSNVLIKDSIFKFMAKQKQKKKLDNLEIITDENRNQELRDNFNEYGLNSFLHQHLLILDDKTVIFGTNNWSYGGFFRNDESIIVSNINSLVSSFNGSFEFNYNKNK